ncbi:hypothetical protein IFM89_011824 [Coptis chinensis]|uniref:HIRAN domain-containing protein n=1 Tax=Coptis chinensis TaxID=261450 RepID=A0A835LHM5_9MAGN|nr:hypothetical protein IFM89_011824 [Coptis chinensis]
MIGLVRETLNPYDSNAIKVLNMRSAQVGYVERDCAAVFAPLMDAGLITTLKEKKKAKDFKSIDDIFTLVSANEDKEEEGVRTKGTLVVCPPSVMSTWITQLTEHTRRGSFKLYLYYGGERTQIVRELQKMRGRYKVKLLLVSKLREEGLYDMGLEIGGVVGLMIKGGVVKLVAVDLFVGDIGFMERFVGDGEID